MPPHGTATEAIQISCGERRVLSGAAVEQDALRDVTCAFALVLVAGAKNWQSGVTIFFYRSNRAGSGSGPLIVGGPPGATIRLSFLVCNIITSLVYLSGRTRTAWKSPESQHSLGFYAIEPLKPYMKNLSIAKFILAFPMKYRCCPCKRSTSEHRKTRSDVRQMPRSGERFGIADQNATEPSHPLDSRIFRNHPPGN